MKAVFLMLSLALAGPLGGWSAGAGLDFDRECRPSLFQRLFGPKPEAPSREWTVKDHAPESRQTALGLNFMFFIDRGRIFVMDSSPQPSDRLFDGYIHIKGISEAKMIVRYGGNLAVLTDGGRVYRLDLGAPRGKKFSGSLRLLYMLNAGGRGKPKWEKTDEGAQHIAVFTLPDGKEALSVSSRLDPFTGKPFDY